MKKISVIITFLVAILPGIILGYLVVKNGVNIPYMDDWDTPGIILTTSQGRLLPWEDWFAQHNESRPLFPRLIFTLLAYLTGWDLRYQMLLSFLLACLIAFNIFYISQKTLKVNSVKLLFLNLLANCLIFSPVTNNWIWGIQTLVFIPIACLTTYGAICYSNLSNKVKLLTGMALATVSTFSYSSGIIVWIISLPFLFYAYSFYQLTRKRKTIFLGLWLIGFIANASLYFYDYQKPAHHPSFLEAIVDPYKTLGFFFAFLGSPLSFSSLITNRLILSQFIGFILVLLFIIACIYVFRFYHDKYLLNSITPWFVIASYTLTSGLIATAGRVGSGIEIALALRYITFSVYLGVGVIYLIAVIFQDIEVIDLQKTKGRFLIKLIAYSLSLAFLFFSLSSFAVGMQSMTIQRQNRLYGKSCVLLINVLPDPACIQTQIYPLDFYFTQDRAKLLSDLGFLNPKLVDSSIFTISKKQKEKPINSHGFLDKFTSLNPDTYTVEGWAIIPEKQKPADAVILTYQQSDNSVIPFKIVEVNQLRLDIVTAFNQPNYQHSGWQINIPTEQIPPEATHLVAWGFDADTGKAYMIRSISLNPSLNNSSESIREEISVSPQSQKTLKDLGQIRMILGYKSFAGMINQVNGSMESEQTITKNTPISITGWSILPSRQLPDRVILTLGSNYTIIAQTSVNIDRPDIAAQFKNPDLIQSGWKVELNDSILTDESTILRAWAYDSTHQEVYRLQNAFKLQKK